MKTYVKITVALIVLIGALYWGVDSIRSRSYGGTDLKAAVGQGAVTITNPQDAPVSVQLISPGTRTFAIASPVAGAAGSSVTQGSGSTATQLLEFAAPAGASQFTLTRGSNVSLVSPSTTRLDVNVQPLSETDARTTILVAAAVILYALYYISKTTGHRWFAALRQRIAPQPVAAPIVQSTTAGQGREMRAYGDNRADISVKP